MEHEEKKGCCENKEKCGCENGAHKCGCDWKKCRMMKLILIVIVVSIIFCLGSQWGEMKSGNRGENRLNRGMMNWNYAKPENKINSGANATGQVTVEVNKVAPEAPKQ